MINNVGFAMAVEKLLGVTQDIPTRAEYIPVNVRELSRLPGIGEKLNERVEILWLVKDFGPCVATIQDVVA